MLSIQLKEVGSYIFPVLVYIYIYIYIYMVKISRKLDKPTMFSNFDISFFIEKRTF